LPLPHSATLLTMLRVLLGFAATMLVYTACWRLLSMLGMGRPMPLAAALAFVVAVFAAAWVARAALAPLRQLRSVAEGHLAGRFELQAPRDLPASTQLIAKALSEHAQRRLHAREDAQDAVERATRSLRDDLALLRDRLKALQSEVEIARASARGKSDLLANMSHELRTPLTAILGFADLLRHTTLSDEQREYVGTLHKSAQGLLSMINDLLDWGRIEAGRLTLHSVGFALPDSVEDTIAMLAPMAYDKQLELVYIIYHDVPLRLRGDPARLQQIMTNLVSNAIKYTTRGEVVLRVMKERDIPGGVRLRINVSDTGRGLSAEQQRHLFEAFSPASRAGDETSTGLGLSIVRRLSEMMDGEVSVESEEGRGSTFGVAINVALPLDPDRGTLSLDALRGSSAWILESHPTARLALTHCLEYWGLRLRLFDSADGLAAALAHANTPPAFVLVGLSESDLSDRAIIELLDHASGGPAVVALVSSVDPAIHSRVLRMGARAALPKSASRPALYRTLTQLGVEHAGTGARPLQNQSLLVADNTTSSRRLIQRMLESLGASVLEAENGEVALKLWAEHRPRFVLMDMRMPVMDGREASRAIRAREGTARGTAIVAISAHMEPDEQQAAFLAGIDDVLAKPFDERQLLRCLGPWLRQQRSTPNEDPPQTTIGERLENDPELAALIAEELPQQLSAIEGAYARGDGIGLREAAHTLHGTAAFYQLRALKEASAQLEQRLARDPANVVSNLRLRDDLARIRVAVGDTLRLLRKR
jgi:two-component system sensor histidine kinase BarA